MKSELSYTLGNPMYEKTQGAETNQIVVYGNIILGLIATGCWAAVSGVIFTFQPDPPLLIKAPVLVTTLLLFDRAVWTICHTRKKSTVTDTPEAHNFERTSFLLPLLLILISKSDEKLSDGQCEPEPITGTILNNGKAIILEDSGNNPLGICEFIQNDATATALWAFCTVPLLLLFGTGWKTLKATQKQNSEETTWIPFAALICLWAISEIVDFWRGLSIKIRLAYIVILVASFLVVTVISLIIRAS